MAGVDDNWWSRAWGGIATTAFSLHLGGALYEAFVIAPLWSASPPSSVRDWAAASLRPDSTVLFHPLVAVLGVASLMAWITGIRARGRRRWWLTLVLVAAGAVTAVSLQLLGPAEETLFGLDEDSGVDDAALVGLAGDWVRAAALRLLALFAGSWAALRAHVAGGASRATAGAVARGAAARGRGGRKVLDAATDFSMGDEDGGARRSPAGASPRQLWQSALHGARRAGKK